MKCILGIGNPGNRYRNTRHNVGFHLLDYFASAFSTKFIPSKSNYYFAEGEINKNHFVLVKPATYVNNSGLAAKHCLNYFNVYLKDFLVVVDDVYLKFGEFRIRESGGDGGHNGLYSIIYHLNDNNFPRLRFGIGNQSEEVDLSEYVLQPFTDEELKILNDQSDIISNLLELFVVNGYSSMLTGYSRIMNKLKNENRNTDSNG